MNDRVMNSAYNVIELRAIHYFINHPDIHIGKHFIYH